MDFAMNHVFIRELTIEDKEAFISAMQGSQSLHHPWIKTPTTAKEFDEYFQRYQQPNQKSFLVCNEAKNIVGVFNISEIVRGLFQNAYLGFYAVADFAGQGYMSTGVKLVLAKIFHELQLHRIEANIQPDNTQSIQLVKKHGFRCEGFSPRYLKINNEWRGHEHWVMTYEDFIRKDADVIKKDCVNIVAYDPEWVTKANVEIHQLRAVFPPEKIIDIQHIGSTAIPGMMAKPVIDIQIVVRSLEEMKVIAIPILQKLGYEYWEENPDPERMFFVKGMPPFGEKRTHHVHIMEQASKQWSEKIKFRDYLIAHPEIAQEYQQLKAKLVEQYRYARDTYTSMKRKFIDEIVKLAQQDQER